VDEAASQLLDWRAAIRLPRRDFRKGVFIASCGLAATVITATIGWALFGDHYRSDHDGMARPWSIARPALMGGTLNAFPEGVKIALRSRM